MNTLKQEAELATKYKYKKLSEELSLRMREYYIKNIPSFLYLEGGGILKTTKGTVICNSYDRIVVGDYGAFVEYSTPACEYAIEPGQEYRIYDDHYKDNVKYEWYTIKDGSHIKIYKQKKGVKYADYIPGKYYISVHEVQT